MLVEINKPKIKIIRKHASIYTIMNICSRVMHIDGQSEKAREMCDKVISSEFEIEAMKIMREYCDIELIWK